MEKARINLQQKWKFTRNEHFAYVFPPLLSKVLALEIQTFFSSLT